MYTKKGSPPRMRGKALLRQCRNCRIGITPAYAGKRLSQCRAPTVIRDHPRVCGEKGLNPVHRCCRSGSPPRMRGKARNVQDPVGSFWDHPRVCGEKLAPPFWNANIGGSPPRMRGKGSSSVSAALCAGITPAYAGKRTSAVSHQFLCEDHPRVCG